MAVNQQDMTELKRLATNFYDNDKACIHRIIMGISNLEKQIRNQKVEIDSLKQQLAAKNGA
jgi:hypothetical protein